PANSRAMVWIARPRRRKALGDGAGGSVHSLDLERGHQRIVNLADELDVQEPVLDDGLLLFVRGGGKPFGKKLVVAERFLSLEAHVETALAVFSLPDLREVEGDPVVPRRKRNAIAGSTGLAPREPTDRLVEGRVLGKRDRSSEGLIPVDLLPVAVP